MPTLLTPNLLLVLGICRPLVMCSAARILYRTTVYLSYEIVWGVLSCSGVHTGAGPTDRETIPSIDRGHRYGGVSSYSQSPKQTCIQHMVRHIRHSRLTQASKRNQERLGKIKGVGRLPNKKPSRMMICTMGWSCPGESCLSSSLHNRILT